MGEVNHNTTSAVNTIKNGFIRLITRINSLITLYLLMAPNISIAQNASPHFINYTTNDGLPSSEVHCVFQDSKGYMWFGTDNGVSRFDGYNFASLNASEDLLGTMVHGIHESSDNKIWLSTLNSEVFIHSHDTIKPYEYNSKIVKYKGSYKYGKLSHLSNNETAYFELLDLGILIIKPNGEDTLIRTKNPTSIMDSILNNLDILQKHFSHQKHSNTGGFWLALGNNKGLVYYKGTTAYKENKCHTFLNRISVTDVLYSEFGLWVTTLEKGVFYCKNFNTQIYNSNFGLPVDFVSSVAFENNDSIYVGLSNEEIWLLNLTEDKASNLYIPTRRNIGQKFVNDLFFDKENKLLWSSNEGQNKSWKDGLKDNWKDTYMPFRGKKFFFDKHSKELWNVGAAGFYSINTKSKFIEWESAQVLDPQRTYSVYKDSFKKTWIGNNHGLFQFKQDTLLPSYINECYNKIRIEEIHESNKQELILGTKGKGVLIYKDQNIQEINTQDGLAANMIEDLEVDEDGNIYVATLNGLSIINFDSLNTPVVRTFTMKHGLPSNEISKVKIHQNQVWLCTSGGLVKWEDIPINKKTYPPILSKILVNGEDLIQKKADFKYDENNLVFEFISLNYKQDGDILYRYRLGVNEAWRHTKSLSVNYPKLSPLDYTFEIQAQNEDGIWSESTLYSFQISKPLWRTIPFILVFILGISAILILFYRQRIKRIKEKAEINEEIVHLQSSILKAQMNPHFVFNCLNSLQSLINRNEKEKANMYLVHFSKLIRGFLNSSVENNISIESEVKLLENYLELEQLRFQSQFKYQIKVEDTIDRFDTHIPPMLIQPFVENAVIHGISNKNDGKLGKINIEFKEEKDLILVTIIDNGIGIKKAQSMNKGNKELNSHNPVGIILTKRRLELISQKTGDWFYIEELYNNTGKTIGTKVSIIIIMKT